MTKALNWIGGSCRHKAAWGLISSEPLIHSFSHVPPPNVPFSSAPYRNVQQSLRTNQCCVLRTTSLCNVNEMNWKSIQAATVMTSSSELTASGWTKVVKKKKHLLNSHKLTQSFSIIHKPSSQCGWMCCTCSRFKQTVHLKIPSYCCY